MYSRMVLMVVSWRYRMSFDANDCVSTVMSGTFYAKTLNELEKSVNEYRFVKMNVFWR